MGPLLVDKPSLNYSSPKIYAARKAKKKINIHNQGNTLLIGSPAGSRGIGPLMWNMEDNHPPRGVAFFKELIKIETLITPLLHRR